MAKLSRRQVLLGGAGLASSALALTVISRRADAAEFTYKFANNAPVDHPINIAGRKAAENIKKESGGRLEIEIFPNNQLGGDTDMLSQLRSGAIEFFTLSGLILSTLVPVAAINGIGFAFKDYDEVWAAMDGELGAYIRARIDKAGLVAMEKIWDNGYREMTSSTKPINTAADLDGFKIRVPVAPLWTSMFKAFGAAPTSINFNEVYSALQTKIVEGQENPLSIIQIAKLYEVQKYCSLTNHMWDGFWFLANARAWNRLPKDLQEIARRNWNAAGLEQRKMIYDLNQSLQGKLESEGLVFNKPDPTSFRDKLRQAGFYKEWQQKFGPEAWALLEKYTGNLSG